MLTRQCCLLLTLFVALIAQSPGWTAGAVRHHSRPRSRPAPRHTLQKNVGRHPRWPPKNQHIMDATYTPTDFTSTSTTVSTSLHIGLDNKTTLKASGGFGSGHPHPGDTLRVTIYELDYSTGSMKVLPNAHGHKVADPAMRIDFDPQHLDMGWTATTTFTAGTLPSTVQEEDVLVMATDDSDPSDVRHISLIIHVLKK